MKSFLKLVGAVFAFALTPLAFSAPAFAQEVATSSYDGGGNSGCGGDTCLPDLSVMINLVGATAGIGEVTAIGDEVAMLVNKESGLYLNGHIDYAGNGCTQVDCDTLSVAAGLNAFENIETLGAAIGTTPGETVAVSNQSIGQIVLGIDFDAIGISSPNGGH